VGESKNHLKREQLDACLKRATWLKVQSKKGGEVRAKGKSSGEFNLSSKWARSDGGKTQEEERGRL